MARMTKADIIEAVYEKVGGFSKKEAAEIVETVFNVVKETLERGEKIKISGFGNFVVRDKKDRMGRDPHVRVGVRLGFVVQVERFDLQHRSRLTGE